MRRYLLDTGEAGHYLARRNKVFDRAKEEVARGNRIGICVPVLGELYFGIELSALRERNLQLLLRDLPTLHHLAIRCLSRSRVWTIGRRTAASGSAHAAD
jgi:predicted nucleic acid-binding protein